ncbi:MAG: hypothetical protein IKZ87_00840 [Actinomycetaceae bacterium]|nr:hypothetical protein [Actinomycetaceae bacterium]
MRIGVIWAGIDERKRPQPYRTLHACVAGEPSEVRRFKMDDDIKEVEHYVQQHLDTPDFYWFVSGGATVYLDNINNERLISGQWFYPDFSTILHSWCYEDEGVVSDDDLLRFTAHLQKFFDRGRDLFGVEYSKSSIVSGYAKAIKSDISCQGLTGLSDEAEGRFMAALSEITRDEWVTVKNAKHDINARPIECSLPHVELARDMLKHPVPDEPKWREVSSSEFDLEKEISEKRAFIGRFVFNEKGKSPSLEKYRSVLPPNWRGDASSDGGFYLTSVEAYYIYETLMFPIEKADTGSFFVYDGELHIPSQSDVLNKFPVMAQFSPTYDLCAHHIVCALCMGDGVPGGKRSALNAWMMSHVRMMLMEYAYNFLQHDGLSVSGYGLNDVKLRALYPDAALAVGARGLVLPHSFFRGHITFIRDLKLLAAV